MWLSLLGTAFFMGLVGGPHCLAMCAAPCAAITTPSRASTAKVLVMQSEAPAVVPGGLPSGRWASFHVGRLLGYSTLGGVAAYAMEAVAWFSDRTSLLHPLWVLLHLAALVWGSVLLLQARQPLWVNASGRRLWSTLQAGVGTSARAGVVGSLWALLPCGLLYSAVMVAALAGGWMQGAASMLAFGVGSGLWLAVGPWLWQRVSGLQRWREAWGLRVAGGMLVAISLWALWMDLVHEPAQWCR